LLQVDLDYIIDNEINSWGDEVPLRLQDIIAGVNTKGYKKIPGLKVVLLVFVNNSDFPLAIVQLSSQIGGNHGAAGPCSQDDNFPHDVFLPLSR
jgi:hypothetical protein